MKNLKKIILVSIIVSSLSGTDFSAKLGYSSMNFGNISDSGTSISMINSKSNIGFAFALGYIKGDTLAVTEFAGLYNWQFINHLYVGIKLALHGINYTSHNNFNESTYSGYTMGLLGKYEINKKNSIDISYGLGSATDDTGEVSEDLTIATISYEYKF